MGGVTGGENGKGNRVPGAFLFFGLGGEGGPETACQGRRTSPSRRKKVTLVGGSTANGRNLDEGCGKGRRILRRWRGEGGVEGLTRTVSVGRGGMG